MNKILLTGSPRTGKSTLLQQHLQGLRLGGFAMQRLTKNGETWAFRLLDLAEEPYLTHLESALSWDDIAIALTATGRWRANLQVFEGKGRRALTKCLTGERLPVLDELGIFEEQALRFQQAVFRVLATNTPVLGVIKCKYSPFLERVRAHPAVRIIPFPGEEAVQAVSTLAADFRQQHKL